MATATVPAVSVDRAIAQVEGLDFTMLKAKAEEPREGAGWDPAHSREAERKYRRFLALHVMFPGECLVPFDRATDEFWHAHIVDTRAYERDCTYLFGELLHHNPYFGMASPSEEEDLHAAFQQTSLLYELAFREPLSLSLAARCTHQPGPQPCNPMPQPQKCGSHC
jgi:hypothetical protein